MRFCFVPALLLLSASTLLAQPTPDVRVPTVEFGAGVSVEHKGAGAVGAVAANLTHNVAIVGEAARSEDGTSVLAGGRVATSFSYDGKPPMPGRFFAQCLVGRQSGNTASSGTIVQPGGGADVLLVPHLGIGLHWSVDYRKISGEPPERSGTRLVVGVLFGPRT